MSKYLVKVQEVWRTDSEGEAKRLVEEAKQSEGCSVLKSSIEYKMKKAKGEIIDEWYRTTIVKEVNDEKEPSLEVSLSYTIDDYLPQINEIESEEEIEQEE